VAICIGCCAAMGTRRAVVAMVTVTILMDSTRMLDLLFRYTTLQQSKKYKISLHTDWFNILIVNFFYPFSP
jgi:hypothetical protein